jgi:hypothetical protein
VVSLVESLKFGVSQPDGVRGLQYALSICDVESLHALGLGFVDRV